MFSTRSGAARLSLGVVIGLVAFKAVVAWVTGSLSILAQMMDSLLDILAVTVTFLAIRVAGKPADREHPFGHGKIEGLAAATQALLIFAAAGFVVYAAVQRIISGEVLRLTEAGIAVMLVSVVASIFLSRHLLRVAREQDSVALLGNAQNIAADVYSAAVVLVGLLAIRFTGLSIIDPILALLFSLFLLKVGYDVLRKSFGHLIDVKLPEEEESIIRQLIIEHGVERVSFHDLRTRKAGRWRYVDLHLVMHKSTSIEEAHVITDHIEHDIAEKLPYSSVIIHVEPCSVECEKCVTPCPQYPSGI